eukprot:s84_g6.t1
MNLEHAAKDLDAQEVAKALAGKKHVWWHHESDDHCTPLPRWINTSLNYWRAIQKAALGKGNRPTASSKAIHLRLSIAPNHLGLKVGESFRMLFVRQYRFSGV